MPQRVCERTVLYRLTYWSIPLDHWLGSTGTKCSCKSVQEQESLFAFRPEPLSQRTWTHCLYYSKSVICLIFPALIRNNAICCKRHWLVVFITEKNTKKHYPADRHALKSRVQYYCTLHRTCSPSSVSCGQNGHEVSAPGLKRKLWALIHDTLAQNLCNASLRCPFIEHMSSSIPKFCFMILYLKKKKK